MTTSQKTKALVYIHGFNSSSASNTLRLLQRHFPHAQGFDYDSDKPFAHNFASLKEQARQLLKQGRGLCLVGSSLGGFYTSQLAAYLQCPCALFNPVVYPAEALRQFLGLNTHFYTAKQWELTPDLCDSYANFTDSRTTDIARFVLLGRNDSLLNPQVAYEYWRHCARIHETQDEHSLTALDNVTIQALHDLQVQAVGVA